ncbi:MAG: TIGR00341 family protein [Phycisphaerales bacterium]|nr:TIGR00341 family protein [Phycisphaerales bacterium]NNM24832.1 TIGR00341 family protein [Phycisphaerales bacterium]
MALRLLEIFAPAPTVEGVRRVLEAVSPVGVWEQTLDDDRKRITVVIDGTKVGQVTDDLVARNADHRGFRVVLVPVTATMPRPEATPATGHAARAALPLRGVSISREELYEDLSAAIRSWPLFLTMAALSTLVAALGIVRENTAAIIGAMVIAPLLGPNMALALATTLGDLALARRALLRNAGGLAAAIAVGVAVGLVANVDPEGRELAARTMVGFADIGLALAAGVAGALAFTSGLSATLVGVMVAVALIPPTATVGLVLGAGYGHLAEDAALLLVVNVICVNLAAVTTFLVQGVHPSAWWERTRARRTAWTVVGAWIALLLTAAIFIMVTGSG